MSWDRFVVVEDSDLGRFEPEATHADQPWGAASWPLQIEQAKRTIRTWVDADYGDLVGASDRLRDRYAFEHVKGFTGSAWTDYTTEAANADEEDITLSTVFTTPGTDYLYCGSRFASTGLFVHLLDSVNDNASVLTVSYWAVNQWQSVTSQSDGTDVSGDTLKQSGYVTWSRLSDWERRSLDGSDEGIYWLRLSINNALTAGTAASQIVAQRMPEGLRAVVAMQALHYVLRGLAIQTPDSAVWTDMADAYRDDARTLYDKLKSTGGIPLDRDLSGAVTPSEMGTSAGFAVGRFRRA